MWNIRPVPVYRLDISVTSAEKHAQSSSTGVTTAICLLIAVRQEDVEDKDMLQRQDSSNTVKFLGEGLSPSRNSK
jgi:hypothetical protein